MAHLILRRRRHSSEHVNLSLQFVLRLTLQISKLVRLHTLSLPLEADGTRASLRLNLP